MNPEMMRQMLERMAAQRAMSTGRSSDPMDNGFFRRSNDNSVPMPEVEMPSANGVRPVPMPEVTIPEQGPPNMSPRGNFLEDILDMIRGMRGEYDGPVRPNPADAPARDPQGRKLTPMGKVGPTETESAGKDAAMLNRAREMARMAAMRRILTSEDIPPSPTR